ncbi:Glutamate receptor ionotropic, delta-1 [Amphibalanus amphitrite]|uniref:Glutamate receptor ionotropic, delta-1 n=1 Tax=Amphibalanus amphitrite TaxID=1232801 RepID=A0A6A4W0E4_AMPAM|nr:Glutamate receptor ionotropic, delta-1 [Amphibalanus amphitrite]
MGWLLVAVVFPICSVCCVEDVPWSVPFSDVISHLTAAGELPATPLHVLPCGNISERALTGLLRRLPCPRGCTVAELCRPCHQQLGAGLYRPSGGTLLLWAGSADCLQPPEELTAGRWVTTDLLLLPPDGMPCPVALSAGVFDRAPFPLCATFDRDVWLIWRRHTYAAADGGARLIGKASRSGLDLMIPALAQSTDMLGTKLRVRFLNNYPYVYCRSVTKDGICRHPLRRPETSLLSVLSQRLNFTLELRQHPRRVWGVQDANGTWRGLVGSLTRDRADLALGGLTMTAERATAVHFLDVLSVVRSVFVTRRPPPLSAYRTVIAPLSPALWALVVLSLLLVAAVLALQRMIRYDSALMEAFQVIVGQDLYADVNTSQQKMFTGMWMIAALIISCVYTSQLTSYLVRGVPARPVETLEQLAASSLQLAVSPNNKVFLQWLDEAPGATFDRLRRKVVLEPCINDTLRQSGPGYQRAHVFEEAFFQYVLAWMLRVQNGSLHREDLVVSRDSFLTTLLAIPVQKHAPYRRPMNSLIGRLTNAGLLQKWLGDRLYVQRRSAARTGACLKQAEQSLMQLP